MFQKSLKFSIVVVVIVSYVTLLFGTGYAAPPTVKLIVNPNKTDVYVGSDPVALTAKATGAGVKFKWELQGPGKIEGTGSAIFYNIPDKIEGESAQAIVTITVTDEAGQEATETFTFNILASKTPEKKEAAPEPAKEGMSRTTKIALGAGAAAALGLGVALAVGGGDDGDKPPFTGSFRMEWTSSVTGADLTWIYNLKQSGTSVTGNYVYTGVDDCCTASFTAPVTGTAEGNNLVLTEAPGEARCEGFGGCWYRIWTDGGTYNFILVDNGRILRSGTNDYTKQKSISGTTEGFQEGEVPVPITGDYIRQ